MFRRFRAPDVSPAAAHRGSRASLTTVLSLVLTAGLAQTSTGPSAHADLGSSAATAGTALPFDLPSRAALRRSPRKVFAHWVPTMPVSLDNRQTTVDYYTRNYLNPRGEGGKHAAYGGFLRDRPLGRPVRFDSAWRLRDMQAEVRQAVAAGIDGFSVVLYHLGGSALAWTDAKLMMQAAASVDPGFKIIIQPDLTGGVGAASPTTLAAYVAELGRSSAAYRVSGGRLVVAPFTPERHSVSWWKQFLSAMRSHGITVAFLPEFQNDIRYRSAFAPISYGMGNWGVRNPAWNNPDTTFPTSPQGRVRAVHNLGKVWMQAVSTQDERPMGGIFDEAQNTTNLRNTWKIATETRSELVQINTWSDYGEGSQMAPSIMNGSSFLDISAYYLTKYKLGTAPKIVRDTVYLTHRKHPWQARPSFPETRLMRLRGGSPARNTIEALTFLTGPARVTIHAGSSSASCAAPAGVGVCTVPLHSGTVSVTVTRRGARVASVTSPHTVTGRPYVQDLHYTAVSSGREGTRG